MSSQLEKDGYQWFRECLSSNDIDVLRSIFIANNNQRIAFNQQSEAFIEALSNVTNCISPILPCAKAVRAVSFNKTKNMNWALPWHQDRVISVAKKEDVNGYSNWSRKAGLWHCEPPVELLKNMLAVRIHLDDTDRQTGALEILKASHKFGKITAHQTEGIMSHCDPIICDAKTGDVLIMKMLTLHRSKPSKTNLSRRAIRIDYSAEKLPTPLQWETD